MDSDKNNLALVKTSFLQGANISFIKELYLKYLSEPKSIPNSWMEFFDGLDEDHAVVVNEILGPSLTPKKDNSLKSRALEKDLSKYEKPNIKKTAFTKEILNKEKEESIKAIALIRAYRIRGHLVANLDPLELKKKKYLDELDLPLDIAQSDNPLMQIHVRLTLIYQKNKERLHSMVARRQ